MKFKINRDHFANGLAQVLNVVGSKAAMPILSNVLIEAEKDSISLTTTNLDLGIRCKIKVRGRQGNAVLFRLDRKSTRLNSSHLGISYAVFCLKKKKNKNTRPPPDATSRHRSQPLLTQQPYTEELSAGELKRQQATTRSNVDDVPSLRRMRQAY